MPPLHRVKVIIITGSMGCGKTTVLGEASDILSACGVVHAAIDLDGIASALLPDEVATDLVYRNLASIWTNYAEAGVTRLLLAEAVENRGALERIRRAISGGEIIVCRLTAALETMHERLRAREPGMLQTQFLDRARELEAVLNGAGLEDFTIVNQDRSVTEVARELLRRAGWIEHTINSH